MFGVIFQAFAYMFRALGYLLGLPIFIGTICLFWWWVLYSMSESDFMKSLGTGGAAVWFFTFIFACCTVRAAFIAYGLAAAKRALRREFDDFRS